VAIGQSMGDTTARFNRLRIEIVKAALWWLRGLVGKQCVGLEHKAFHPEHEIG
jgi:hypothetical protein